MANDNAIQLGGSAQATKLAQTQQDSLVARQSSEDFFKLIKDKYPFIGQFAAMIEGKAQLAENPHSRPGDTEHRNPSPVGSNTVTLAALNSAKDQQAAINASKSQPALPAFS